MIKFITSEYIDAIDIDKIRILNKYADIYAEFFISQDKHDKELIHIEIGFADNPLTLIEPALSFLTEHLDYC